MPTPEPHRDTTLLGKPPCPACHGRGLVDTHTETTIEGHKTTATDSRWCGACEGSGVRTPAPCAVCKGTGVYDGDPCPDCKGTGKCDCGECAELYAMSRKEIHP